MPDRPLSLSVCSPPLCSTTEQINITTYADSGPIIITFVSSNINELQPPAPIQISDPVNLSYSTSYVPRVGLSQTLALPAFVPSASFVQSAKLTWTLSGAGSTGATTSVAELSWAANSSESQSFSVTRGQMAGSIMISFVSSGQRALLACLCVFFAASVLHPGSNRLYPIGQIKFDSMLFSLPLCCTFRHC